MKSMGCRRAAAVIALLAGWILVSLPAMATGATAARDKPGDGLALDMATAAPPQMGGERTMAGERRDATLSVNVAIMALGGLWLALMARRMQLRGELNSGELSSGVPRHVAGGR